GIEATADLQINVSGAVTVSGSIEALACAFGTANANANAQMRIVAQGAASVGGSLIVTAFASQFGLGPDHALADAGLDLEAHSIEVTGSIDVNASAIACGDGFAGANASAVANIAAVDQVDANGIRTKALANQRNASGGQAIGVANLQLQGGSIN